MNYPRKFVKLPVEVEAMRVEGKPADRHKVYSWMLDNGYPQLMGNALNPEELYDPALGKTVRPTKGVWIDPETGDFMIRTIEGDRRVKYGDWVIRGITGDFYPCKTEHFYLHHKFSHGGDSKMNYPRKFVKLPVEVEAMRLEGTTTDCHHVYTWMVDNGYPPLFGNALNPKELYDPVLGKEVRPTKGVWIDPEHGNFMIRTSRGDIRVEYGDWIIRGVAGEFYPCKPDIFNKTYKLSENHD